MSFWNIIKYLAHVVKQFPKSNCSSSCKQVIIHWSLLPQSSSRDVLNCGQWSECFLPMSILCWDVTIIECVYDRAVDCKRRLLCNECIRANYRSSDAANLFPIIPNLIYCFVICWFSYSPCHPRLQPPARPRTQTQNIRIGGDRSLSKQTPLFCPHLS